MHIGVLQRLDDIIYDARLRATMPRTLDERIVIVDLDEKSLAEVGRWPWGRNRLADLVEELLERQKAALLGFDIVFAEADDSSGLKRLRQLAHGRTEGPARLSPKSSTSSRPAWTTTRYLPSRWKSGRWCWATTSPATGTGAAPGVLAGAGHATRKACTAGRSSSRTGTATAPTSSSWPRRRRWPASSIRSSTATAWCARSR